MPNVFAVPVFFICFRESMETSIVVAVLLALLKGTVNPQSDRALYRKLLKQVWLGVGLGVAICLVIGCAMIGAFYGAGRNAFSASEALWEGVFALIAAVIITIMGAAMLRVSKLREKWSVKLRKAMEARDSASSGGGGKLKTWAKKYAMFVLPFVTVLREGIEAVLFAGGVGLGLPASSIPLPVITGLAAGCLVGYLIYRGGNMARLQVFLVVSTCFLYLVAAGLFARGVGAIEQNEWNKIVGGDAAETGAGPGSYDIRKSVWHVNCCSPAINGGGGWGVFNSLLGWTNSATYGTVISYNLYWAFVILAFLVLRYQEVRGRWPLMKPRKESEAVASDSEDGSGGEISDSGVKKEPGYGVVQFKV